MIVRIRGFTLIELLIVVAIIAILAAIAVPNLLEAQVRSKVSRVKADQRAYALALEAYYTDWNAYPCDILILLTQGCPGTDSDGISNSLRPVLEEMARGLSTPIAYMTDAYILEPFNGKKGWVLYRGCDVLAQQGNCPIAHLPMYLYLALPSDEVTSAFLPIFLLAADPPIPPPLIGHYTGELEGKRWFVMSPGPDTFYSFDRCMIQQNNPVACLIQQILDGMIDEQGGIYDPTNGTVSQGEIVRTASGISMNTK